MRSYRIRLRLTEPDSPQKFKPRAIFDKFPNLRRTAPIDPATLTGKKTTNDWRFGPLIVDWIDSNMTSPGKSSLPTHMKDDASINAASHEKYGTASGQFIPRRVTSGSTQLPEGTVHIFRESAGCTEELGSLTTDDATESASDYGTTLAVLAVPPHMTPSDFLTFVAPAAESIAHLRMIRDSAPNRTMVVMKFRGAEEAKEFAQEYNGRPFNAMEPEICHVVNVLSVEIEGNDATSLAISRLASSQGNMYELPTCPVCLERMDAAVTGLVTVPCSHTFHCMCLSKWGDSRCPVCRYSQTLLSSHPSARRAPFSPASGPSLSVCFDCSSTTNLWICLICGNVGCGRYGRAHAHAHYALTTHLYALELETQRVWDYAGDGYVHRLIQNKTDGKLVELPSASAMTSGRGVGTGPGLEDALNAEKIEAIGIEYSYLLTSQLDSQREHYETQKTHIEELLQGAQAKVEELEREAQARAELHEQQMQYLRQEEDVRQAELVRERQRAEKRAEKLAEAARTLERELKEERAVSEGLLRNLGKVKERVDLADKERSDFTARMKDMEEQLRDLMIYLDAKEKIQQEGGGLEDAVGGTVELPETPQGKTRKKKGKR